MNLNSRRSAFRDVVSTIVGILLITGVIVGATLTVTVTSQNGISTNSYYKITVETDQQYYYIGETVNASGRLTENGTGVPYGFVCIDIKNPDNISLFSVCGLTNETGYFYFLYYLDPFIPEIILGIYNVTVHKSDDPNVSAYTNFEVVSSNVTPDANGPYYGIVNQSIQFYGDVNGGKPPYTWHWDFGDGNTSTEQNPTYTYTEIGNYVVNLTVIDNQSHDGSVETTAFIQGQGSGFLLTVFTDKLQYYPEETVTIFGQLTYDGVGVPCAEIYLEVRDPLALSLIHI